MYMKLMRERMDLSEPPIVDVVSPSLTWTVDVALVKRLVGNHQTAYPSGGRVGVDVDWSCGSHSWTPRGGCVREDAAAESPWPRACMVATMPRSWLTRLRS